MFQQYIFVTHVRIESGRTNWIRNNKKQLRADSYAGWMDYVQKKAFDENLRVGKIVILPLTFVGSDRYYLQNYNDAMAIVGEFGKPDLFCTYTWNSSWTEITNSLYHSQLPCNRPDNRVFNLKHKILLKISSLETNISVK